LSSTAFHQPISEEAIRRLHREEIAGGAEIRAIFAGVYERAVELFGGLNSLTEPKRAYLTRLGSDRLTLRTKGFGRLDVGQMFLSFDLDRTSYFFVGVPLAARNHGDVDIEIPEVIYKVERRDLRRRVPAGENGAPRRVTLWGPGGSNRRARVTDWSRQGVGLLVSETDDLPVATRVGVHFAGEKGAGGELHGVVRHRQRDGSQGGWVRLGLSLSAVEPPRLVEVERRSDILGGQPRAAGPTAGGLRAGRLGSLLRGGLGGHGDRPRSEVIDFRNRRGERIRAIADWTGDPREGPLVLVPPAWGRTKETLLPLALTLIESFRRAGRAMAVLRFDGIRRRGESHNDPGCLTPGREYLHFTFSQAVDDIHAALDFVESSPRFRPSKVILVTSSVSAIEGRRAIASDPKKRISGWVSLVGIADLRGALWEFSGGVDYGSGVMAGVGFGVQELLGVACDADLLARNAVEQELWFFEDARREMAKITIPVTWIHGRDDGWMQLERGREILSCGDSSQRCLIEIPTGHQLRAGPEALEAFQLVAREVSRMALGGEIATEPPPARTLEKRQKRERRRLPSPKFDLRRFWRDYLVGRRGVVGIELLTATSAYQGLMDDQIRALGLRDSERVADLGSGAGDFACRLLRRDNGDAGVRVYAVDYVGEALERGRRRLAGRDWPAGPALLPVVANLDARKGQTAIPFRSRSFDAVLASLLLGYLTDAEAVLREIHRILKPRGRLVLSTLRRDADISKIYTDSVAELQPDRLRRIFSEAVAADIEQLRQDFLSDASRIIDLEEFGYFRFWSSRELEELIAKAGFVDIETRPSFGNPPQAILASCERP